MRRILVMLVFMAGIIVAFYFILKNYLHVDPEHLVRLSLPPAVDISKNFPQGGDVEFPLQVPEGFRLGLFADLKGQLPRVLEFGPQGVLFASLTKIGEVVALPDRNRDGIADEIIEVLTDLDRPHGLAFKDNKFYVAETDKIVVYDYDSAAIAASNPETIFTLPAGGRHFTRTIAIYEDKLYTSVGSSCDTCFEDDEKRAAILVSDLNGENLRVFAKGLRNTVFFTFGELGRMWGNDMGRDFLGDNLPPDELNIISEGQDYGWPLCYGNRVHDKVFDKNVYKESPCKSTVPPVFRYPAHVAPLGLTFIDSEIFPLEDQGDLLSVFHGSWNSSQPVGYKIVKLDVIADNVFESEDFITGWITSDGDVLGRPVDLKFDNRGLLYISDDKAGLIYILTKENSKL